LAPGFIDVHTHDDTMVIRQPQMLPKLSQGVTTVIVGNCGISASPVSLQGEPPDPMNLLGPKEAFRYPRFADYRAAVEQAEPAVNVAALVGHTALRSNHLDRLDRTATSAEISAMRTQLADSLRDGALGLSSGLAYPSAFSADSTELEQLAAELNTCGRTYTTHLRSEFQPVLEAMERSLAGWAAIPIARSSTLDLKQVTGDFEIFITWSTPHPEMAGQTLQAIAEQWQLPLMDAARKLQPAGAVYHGMDPADVENILRHPLTMVGSDGLPEDPLPHPRLWGAFPRVLGYYCRERQLFSLETAVHKMTGLSASRFALDERGLIRPGYWADLVLFDAATIHDTATFHAPIQAAAGISAVWVNGVLSWQDRAATGVRAGNPLMSDLKRFGIAGGTGGQQMPFARAVQAADGWLYVSGQTPMVNGEVIEGGIVTQSHQCIQNVMAILEEAGYGPEHVVRCGVWLDDTRDFCLVQPPCLGEGMIELSGQPLQRRFGGDTLNTAIYLARLLADSPHDVRYLSGMGQDKLSKQLLADWQAEGVDVSHIVIQPGKLPGLYMVETDAQGERSFFYWRSDSAARHYFAS
uniref:Amidohydrolase 3 domain-containing protein n=1 Tax=Anopheles coluzzii TaxID=1518534 RepID=A0A8W7PL26_ANOCL